MTEQEKEILEEEVTEEVQEETASETDAAEEAAEEVLDPEKLAADLAELNQRFLRTAADFENYKRRTAQEKDDLLKYSNARLMGELLPVLDNFQLALRTPGESQEAQNVIKGVEMIYRQMVQALEQAGMTKIEAVGQPFNPNLHEAIMQVEDDTVPEDTVVEELRAGYMLKERVIRPSMVKVSK
ncbi:MAG: nucleotide exchange factor GrpE [Peptococcaceae bacterium]|nr:nucleotide exchange factor GrpE [Peptococcaceae bacterium]